MACTTMVIPLRETVRVSGVTFSVDVYEASCSCGWVKTKDWRGDARAAADQHKAEASDKDSQ